MKINNPIKLVLLGVLVAIVCWLLIIVIAGIFSSGGQQLPLTIFARGIKIFPIIGIILSIISVFAYREWSKKYWYLVGLVVLLFSLLLIYVN